MGEAKNDSLRIEECSNLIEAFLNEEMVVLPNLDGKGGYIYEDKGRFSDEIFDIKSSVKSHLFPMEDLVEKINR